MNGVILFTGENCPGCKVMKERFNILKTMYSDRIEFDKYDIEENQDLALKYGIVSIPAIIFLKDEEPIDMAVGVTPLESLERVITQELL